MKKSNDAARMKAIQVARRYAAGGRTPLPANKPKDEGTEIKGGDSSWAQSLPRIQDALNALRARDLAESPWLPVHPNMDDAVINTFNPGASLPNMPSYPAWPWLKENMDRQDRRSGRNFADGGTPAQPYDLAKSVDDYVARLPNIPRPRYMPFSGAGNPFSNTAAESFNRTGHAIGSMWPDYAPGERESDNVELKLAPKYADGGSPQVEDQIPMPAYNPQMPSFPSSRRGALESIYGPMQSWADRAHSAIDESIPEEIANHTHAYPSLAHYAVMMGLDYPASLTRAASKGIDWMRGDPDATQSNMGDATSAGWAVAPYLRPLAKPIGKLVAKYAAPLLGASMLTASPTGKPQDAQAAETIGGTEIGDFGDQTPYRMAEATQKKGQPIKGSGRVDTGGWSPENATGPYPGPNRGTDDTLSLQQEMINKGYFSGKPDGVDGDGTRKAEWRMIKAERGEAETASKRTQGLADLDTAKNDPKNEPFMSNNSAYAWGLGGGAAAASAIELAFNLASRGKVRSANKLLEKAGLPRKEATLSDRAANINEFAKRGGAGEEVPYVPAPRTEAGWKFDKDSMPATQLFPKTEDPWMSPQNLLHGGFMAGAGADASLSYLNQRKSEDERDQAYADMMDPVKHPNGPDTATIGRYIDAKKDAEFWERIGNIGKTWALGTFAGAKLGKIAPKGTGPDTNLAGAEIGNLNKEILKTNKASTAYAKKAKAEQEQKAAAAEAKAQQKAEAAAARKEAKKKKPNGAGDPGQGKLLGVAGAGSLLPTSAGEDEEPTLPVSPELTLAPSISPDQAEPHKDGGTVKHHSHFQPRDPIGKFAGGPVYRKPVSGDTSGKKQGVKYDVSSALKVAKKASGGSLVHDPNGPDWSPADRGDDWILNLPRVQGIDDTIGMEEKPSPWAPWAPREADVPSRSVVYDPYDITSRLKSLNQNRSEFARGGVPPAAMGANNHGRIRSGLIHGDTGGRADKRPVQVPSGSFVFPADVVSALGQGNTMAGGKVLDSMLGPDTQPSFAMGGEPSSEVPIMISDGEYLASPQQIAKWGGGDISKSHGVADAFVKKIRGGNIQMLRSLPPPEKN